MGRFVAISTLLACLVLQQAEGAKILVIPIPLKSALRLGLQTGQTLMESGHEVWLMGPGRGKGDAVKTGFHYLEYDTSAADTFEDESGLRMASAIADPDSTHQAGPLQMMGIAKEMNAKMCNNTLSNKALMNRIRDQKFDLALLGTTLVMSCMYLVPYKFDIPYITFEPLDEPWIAGVTALPSAQPMVMAPVANKMSFSERLWNTMLTFTFPLAINYMASGDYASWFVPEKPDKSFHELRSLSQMWFIVYDNTCLDYPRQSAPNYRIIGAITQKPAKPLTGELKQFVDGAKDGLVLITFGSFKAGGETLRLLLPMLRKIAPQIRQRVLLQLSIDDDPGKFPANIRFERWTPQNDVLGHPNTVAMVNHGGANGQMEATYHGLPQICIGIQEEQIHNCHRLEDHHYGLSLTLSSFTAEDFLHALTEITTDPSYKRNVSHCSRIMRSLPGGKQQLSFWVNHILEFGGDHLRPSSADMPFYSLYMLDILAFVLLLLVLVIGVVITCLKCICRCAKNMTTKAKKD